MTPEDAFDVRPERPGFRLQRLELFNWGTFDSTSGKIYSFEPQGRTSLLVGCNGSGKSTLVDAVLTLLVPAQIRNYNVAAGGKKTERSEKSYVRGAYGHDSDENQSSVVKYLRPKSNQISALLAVFRDEQADRVFTICQMLYMTADGTEKFHAISDDPRTLKSDLAGLQQSDKIRAHLQRLGYQVTKNFSEYDGWIAKRTKMRNKAMDMFNQTVAVKDIQSLNKFIRDHMLEAHDWRQKVQRLLAHFNDLSIAHQELVRAKLAEQLLAPIEFLGQDYRTQSGRLIGLKRRLKAWETFYAVEFLRLGKPELDFQREQLSTAISTKDRLAEEIQSMNDQIGTIRRDIEEAGGQRLKDLPHLIRDQQSQENVKRAEWERYQAQLRRCGVDDTVVETGAFAEVRTKLADVVAQSNLQHQALTKLQDEAIALRATVHRQLQEEQEELQILGQRHSNLPSYLTTLRGRMCADLQLPESDLPFASELISVSAQERKWEASIEMVLRSFALSLLVPEGLYPRVRAYVDLNKMANDRGEGQKLVYRCVGKADNDADRGDRLHAQSMLRKLDFRRGRDLVPWVRAEVARRFDFRCCDSIEQFNEVERYGLTANRHVKFGLDRNEKDDRQRTVDPRYYVLGWDNREKRQLIQANLNTLQQRYNGLDSDVTRRRDLLRQLDEKLAAANEASTRAEFDSIDYGRHAALAAQLQLEKSDLETSNTKIQTLRHTLQKMQGEAQRLNHDRDEIVMNVSTLRNEIDGHEQLLRNCETVISQVKAEGVFDLYQNEFKAILGSFDEPLSLPLLLKKRQSWPEAIRRQVDNIENALKPLARDLTNAMLRYLKEFKEQQNDLDAGVEALDAFLQLLEQLRREDLPRYEKQFKDRLNDKVSQEVALLNASLRQECKHIEDKIRQLNTALSTLEYRPSTSVQSGTFMRLDPKEVIDKDIGEFRRSLRECLDESLENTEEANEARFLRIKKLVERLAAKENVRWREKVIDTRYWFDFKASEIQKDDGKVRSSYEDSAGQSGGEKAKLAFTILVAAIAYQYDIDPSGRTPGRFQFVVVDEMFSKVDDQNAHYALRLFQQFGLQLLIVAPLDAKARITEPFVDCYLHAVKDEASNHSELFSMSAREYEEVIKDFSPARTASQRRIAGAK